MQPFKFILLLLLFCTAACAAPEQKERVFEFPDSGVIPDRWQAGADYRDVLPLFAVTDDWLDRAAGPPDPPPAWLGVFFRRAPAESLDPETKKKRNAIKILHVFPGSPADKAGLIPGDLVTGLDGRRFEETSWDEVLSRFHERIVQQDPGRPLALELLRGEQIENVNVRLVPRPKTAAHLPPTKTLDAERRRVQPSLVVHALEKGRLERSFARTVKAIRNGAAEVVSQAVKADSPLQGARSSSWEGFNPFRLSAVNRALYYPLELPLLAKELVDAATPMSPDLSLQVAAGMRALDLDIPPTPEPTSPVGLEKFVSRFVDAVGQAEALREEALAGLDPDEIDLLYGMGAELLAGDPREAPAEPPPEKQDATEKILLRFLHAALKVDLGKLLEAGLTIARALDIATLKKLKATGAMTVSANPGWTLKKEGDRTVVQTPRGTLVIGGPGDDVYTEDALLIIDPGGNDRYLNRAGGGGRRHPFAAVVDLAGDDRYESVAEFSQGAALLGAGLLIDLEGDDRYEAADYSQGAGILGVGILADLQGDDVYKGHAATQGAAAFGIGLLVEGGGRDDYTAARYTQGFGFVKGYGALIDREGDDRYYAGGVFPDPREKPYSFESLAQGFGFGLRPVDTIVGASGGIGLLADGGGDDTYVADYFAQGASYWYALGILSDRDGNDHYKAGRYAQGAGVHLSAGVLSDRAGNDVYRAGFGVAQGLGHDLAAGFLLDGAGDDTYFCGVMCQGAGNDNGIGVLNDQAGDDRYRVDGPGQGSGNHVPVRGLDSFGLIVDTGAGRDTYSSGRPNRGLTFRPQWGLQADH